jgi:ABC-type lipoprotein release transport system permease subunit
MPLLIRLAWRNLWRNKRRTRLTLSAMVMACALLLFSLAIYEGMFFDMIANATEMQQGHVVLANPEWHHDPLIEHTVAGGALDRLQRSRLPGVRGVCGRVACFALLSCGEGRESRTHPAELLGIDPVAEQGVARLGRSIIAGRYLTASATDELVLGEGLAKRLEATVGDEVVLMGQGADGSMVSGLFTLVGVLRTGDSMRDTGLAVAGVGTMQDLFVLNGRLHSISLFLDDPNQAATIASAAGALDPHLAAMTWQRLFPQLWETLHIWWAIQIIMMVIYYFAVFLITFNTMTMAFFERMREFAVLTALGMRRLGLAGLILLEGLLLGILAGTLGTVLGAGAAHWLFLHPFDLSPWMGDLSWGGTSLQPRLIGVLTTTNVGMPLVSMIGLGVVVAALPVFRLWSMRPIDALRES